MSRGYSEAYLTPWYPAEILPVRKGYYQVRNTEVCPAKHRLTIALYRYWNGKGWKAWKGGIPSVMNDRTRVGWYMWRGCIHKAKKRK